MEKTNQTKSNCKKGCDCNIIHKETLEEVKAKMPNDNLLLEMADFYKALSDSTRIKIIAALAHNELCVCDIAEILSMTHSAVSHQLSVLRQNRIIKYRREGKNIFYSLDDEHIQMIYNAGMEHIIESLHADR